MRKLIFILLFPLLGFSQADLGLINSYARALELQNGVRTWYNVSPLVIDPTLELEAQLWAEQMAKTDTFENSPYDSLRGESIYWTLLSNNIADPYYDATIGWILDVTKEKENQAPFLQMIYPNATSVGFGKAASKNAVYIVAKYNKLYE